jgi:large subunit ribosomal protein L21
MAESYAIVESGGKQYRAQKGDVLVVDRLPADEGAKVSLRPVAYLGENLAAGSAELEKVKVEALVKGHERGPKLQIVKYKAKKGYRRRTGYRSELTRLEVTDVKLLARKPAATKAAPKPPARSGAKKAADGS